MTPTDCWRGTAWAALCDRGKVFIGVFGLARGALTATERN
jgi:hypothetical protein